MKTFSVSNYLFKAASILELLIGMCVLILCLVCGLGMILPVEPLHSFGNAATIRTGLIRLKQFWILSRLPFPGK